MAFECPRRSSPPSPMFDADTGCIATDPAPSARRRFRSKTGIENLPANEHAQETPHTPSPTRTTRRIQSGCAGSRPRLRDGMPGSPSQHIDITRAKWIPYIANTYLAGTNTRRVRRALAGLFGGKVGKDAVSRAWRKVKTDWESWQARDLSDEDIVRLILDGTGVKARLDGRVLSIPLLVVLGVRRDGQKVLLASQEHGRGDRGGLAPCPGGPSRPWPEGAGASDRRRRQGPGGGAGQPVERYSGAALHGAQGSATSSPMRRRRCTTRSRPTTPT